MTTDQSILTDGQLLSDYASSRSGESFEQVVQRHASLVLGVCRQILRESNDADDAAQAAFITLAEKAPSLRDRASVAGWLHRVALHISLRAREARNLRRQREGEFAAQCEPTSDSPDASDGAAVLHEHLALLPEKYRLPLVMHHLQGWSEREVAKMLGCKLGTVSGRLNRGRALLKRQLESRGFGGVSLIAIGASRVESAVVAQLSQHATGACAPPSATLEHAMLLAQGAISTIDRQRTRSIMVTGALIAIIAALIGVGVVAYAPFQHATPIAPATAPARINVTGILVGPSGGPVRNAVVQIYSDRAAAQRGDAPLLIIRTRNDGSFAIDDRRADRSYFMIATASGTPPIQLEREFTASRDDRSIELGTLVMQPEER